MRELKFRAYAGGVMVYFRLEDITRIYTYPAGFQVKSGLSVNFPKEFMQYTGLKDKNGVEIYEGDIVNHLKYGGDWQIYWNDKSTGYSLKCKYDHMHLCSLCCPNIEVIGNIYENPELLK